MTIAEREILGIPYFHPVYFFQPGIRSIIVALESDTSTPVIMRFKLGGDGRVKQYDHMESGWLAYAPGQKPEPNLDITQNTRILQKASGSLESTTTNIASGKILRTVHYLMQDRRLVEQRTSIFRNGQRGKCEGNMIFVYDREGRVSKIRRSLQTEDLCRESETLIERNSDGLVIGRIHLLDTLSGRDQQSKVIQTDFEYDSDSRLVRAESYRNQREIGGEVHLYEIVGRHLFVRIVRRTDGSNQAETRFEYNSDGLLTRKIIRHDELSEETIHSYEYVT